MAAPTPKTKADLAAAALLEIRILRAGEAATQAQRAQSDEKYAAILAELQVIGLGFWDEDAIPLTVFDPLSMLVAQRLAPSFGKAYSAGDAMARLRVVAAKPWSGKTVRSQYY